VISAYNGIETGIDTDALDSSDVGYNIEGASGILIGLNMDQTTIYVPIND